MICKNCGTENEEGNVFCINCGSRVEGDVNAAEPLMPMMGKTDPTVSAANPPAEPEGPAPIPFVSSEKPMAYQPPTSPQPQPIYAPPPVYQQPMAPPPPPPPVLPQAPKGPPDTCRTFRMPTAPDMPGLSFFDGTTLQYFGYMLLFGFLNMLVVGMPIVLLAVFGGITTEKIGAGFDYTAFIDLSDVGAGYVVLIVIVAVLALLVSLILMAWMYTVLLRWMSHHTIVNDHRLVFVGHTGTLLKKIVIYWLLTAITAGIFAIWVPVKLLRWKAANTRFAT